MSFCTKCGTELDTKTHFCPNCGTENEPGNGQKKTATKSAKSPKPTAAKSASAPQPAAQETAAPEQAVTPPAAEMDYIGLGPRFAAHIVDVFIVGIMFWMIGSNIAGSTGGSTEAGFELQGGPALLAMTLTFVAATLYFSILESMWNGQTLGKKMMGIKVVAEDGSKCSFTQALTRNIVRVLDAFLIYIIGIVSVIASKKKQRVGDRVAHTVVIRASKRERQDRKDKKDKKDKSGIRFSMGTRSGYTDL